MCSSSKEDGENAPLSLPSLGSCSDYVHFSSTGGMEREELECAQIVCALKELSLDKLR